MGRETTRRAALKGLGLGAASLGVTAGWDGVAIGRARSRSRPGVAELADRLEVGSSEEAFEAAASAMANGAGATEVLLASYLLGARDINPRPVGNVLHAVLMVESSFELGARSSARDAERFAFWNLHEVKRGQEVDRRNGDWRLEPPPAVLPKASQARAEFRRGMDEWDIERADAAAVVLLGELDRDAFFQEVWPSVARSSVDLGHKAVIGAHTHALAGRLGWAAAGPPVRAMLRSLLHTRNGGRYDEAYRSAKAIGGETRWSTSGGAAEPEQPERSMEILRAVRSASRTDAQTRVHAAMQEGLGPRTIWDGIRLFAHHAVLCRSGTEPTSGKALGPVHAATAANGLATAFTQASNESVRRDITLATVGWICDLRDEMARRVNLIVDAPGLEGMLDESAEETVGAELFEMESPQPSQACAHLAADPARATGYTRRLVAELARKAVETHQIKFAAAMFQDAARSHPRWRPAILATALPYLPTAPDEETDLFARTEQALRSVRDGRR